MRLTKAQRAQLRTMYDGHCAYCGIVLPDKWHADHFEFIQRDHKRVETSDGSGKWVAAPPLRPEFDVIENYRPSCAPCNLSKGRMDLETWRGWLAGHVTSLNSYHPTYRLAKQYGLIQETGAAVVFHFERVDGSKGA